MSDADTPDRSKPGQLRCINGCAGRRRSWHRDVRSTIASENAISSAGTGPKVGLSMVPLPLLSLGLRWLGRERREQIWSSGKQYTAKEAE